MPQLEPMDLEELDREFTRCGITSKQYYELTAECNYDAAGVWTDEQLGKAARDSGLTTPDQVREAADMKTKLGPGVTIEVLEKTPRIICGW